MVVVVLVDVEVGDVVPPPKGEVVVVVGTGP
jgi:hypothetical protein